MVRRGEAGALGGKEVLTGVGCGGVLRKAQRSSFVKFCIMWGRVAVLVFSMILGVDLFL